MGPAWHCLARPGQGTGLGIAVVQARSQADVKRLVQGQTEVFDLQRQARHLQRHGLGKGKVLDAERTIIQLKIIHHQGPGPVDLPC